MEYTEYGRCTVPFGGNKVPVRMVVILLDLNQNPSDNVSAHGASQQIVVGEGILGLGIFTDKNGIITEVLQIGDINP